MFPNLLTLGPFTIHTYGLFLALGFFAGVLVAWLIREREGIDSRQVTEMTLLIIIAGVIGSRSFYAFTNMSLYRDRPMDVFKIWDGGFVFAGGVIVALAVIAFYAKRRRLPFLILGDLWAPAVAIGQSIGRIGCFFSGCCYGRPTDLKWGVVFTNPHSPAPLNVALHPTQLYSAATSFAIFIVLLVLQAKKKFEGQVFLWFLILHSTGLLAIERYRGDERGMLLGDNMTLTQLGATLILMTAVITLFVLKSKRND